MGKGGGGICGVEDFKNTMAVILMGFLFIFVVGFVLYVDGVWGL